MREQDATQETYMQTACNVIFTQMNANTGLKNYGQPAVASMVKEFKQLNEGVVPGNPVVVPVDVNSDGPREK